MTRILLFALMLLAAGPAAASKLLFVTTSPVQPGKFRLLAELAQAHGMEVEVQYVEKLPPDPDGRLFAGFDAVFFDTPRDHLRDAVRARLGTALGALGAPALWLHEANPNWQRLPDALARRLHAHYVNGGRANFERFFRAYALHRAGESWSGVPPPIVFPKAAIYHPRAPELVFPDPPAYFAWQGIGAGERPPVIAIALHHAYLAAEQTGFVHDLIERIEAAGAVALPFYGPVMEPESLREMTTAEGHPVVDVIINTQIMLDPEGRRAAFEALGVPVVQAMPYRRGDEAAWRADPQGVALMDVPFYLAQAEHAGVADIQVAAATREDDDQMVPIAEQSAAVVAKALALVALQRKPNRDKRLALYFWNYPPGEKNLSASYLNLPRSLEATLAALQGAGYRTEAASETVLIERLQQTLTPFYRDEPLEPLLGQGLAALYPVAAYREWLSTLPEAVRNRLSERFGPPERSAMVIRHEGQPHFVIPRAEFGNVVILPQPPRGERWEDKERTLYHDPDAAPSHFYLATYLWVRTALGADAIVHYGTHGTQEWLPGKERGLATSDFPMLVVGDVPVVYPYIMDNIGEALQAKRRGRAVVVSHQTPPFQPAGLHQSLVNIHDLLHAWLAQDDGAVKERLRVDLLAAVQRERIDRDLGWDDARIATDFAGFADAVHDQLHELARTAQPLGLHTFGRAPEQVHRLATVLAMLGETFWEASAGPDEEADELLVDDYARLAESTPYRLLARHVLDGEPPDAFAPALRPELEKARAWYDALGAEGEQAALLRALDGRHVPTSYGGDPIKNPESLPTGRNLYGFDPSRVPTPQAWEAGKEAAEALIAAHRARSGTIPRKLAFSLWSVETMRHQGMLEAQVLWALGVEPVWDRGGRITDVTLIDRETLGRPRIDAVISATGLYRDHFPNAMSILAKAVALAAAAEEPDNPVAANSRAVAAQLVQRGVPEAAAIKAGETRIFSSESGRYGTGLDDATLATDTWEGKGEGDRKLAELYLSRMQFAYGADEADWGAAGSVLTEGVNLYAEHLRGTEGAVLSRTSNLYGMLTTDDPFQYLGGLALAVRHLDGQAPELYISNLRGAGSGKVEGADAFLAKELATRNFHPGFIEGLMKEGYAGTLQVLDATNNFWGWTAVAREIVRDDQWQTFVDVYVRDKHRLGLDEWFERHNPHALAQVIERMLEAVRQGYWDADAGVVAELKARYRDLAQRFDVRSDNAPFEDLVGTGFGLDAAAPPAGEAPPQSPEAAADTAPRPTELVEGQRLERVQSAPEHAVPWLDVLLAALIATAFAAGVLRQARRPRLLPLSFPERGAM